MNERLSVVHYYKRIVKAMADAVSAARTGHMRVSTASGPTASAALLPDGCAAPTAADPFEFELLEEVGADAVDLVKDG